MRRPTKDALLGAIDALAKAQHEFQVEEERECDGDLNRMQRLYRAYDRQRAKLRGMIDRLYGDAKPVPPRPTNEATG